MEKLIIIGGALCAGALFVFLLSKLSGGNEEYELLIDKLERLQTQYNNVFKVYSENPEKFAEYREEFLAWQQKIENNRNEYFFKVLKDTLVTEEWQYDKVTEMIATLEQFQEWNKGKIEY